MITQAIDREMLDIKSLFTRKHDLDLSIIKDLNDPIPTVQFRNIREVARRIHRARERSAAVILMMGAHVFRSGVQMFIIDLMKRGYINHLAINGAGIIHDFELSLIGATTENVERYIREGQFGLWKETGYLNEIINSAYQEDAQTGMGWVVGKAIYEGDYRYKVISLLAAGYRLKIPVTVHVSIGQDIIHELPNCDGAATGALSYNDFLSFAASVQKLENGVIMNFGSAVMAPEVFLKALSMARNIAHQRGDAIRRFTTFVCDLHDLPESVAKEPSKKDFFYYFRPWKTMLARAVKEGGESFYQKGLHEETIPKLWKAIGEVEEL